MRRILPAVWLASAVVLAGIASATAFRHSALPYLWSAAAAVGVCLVGMLTASTRTRRAVWFNVAVAIAGLAVLEGYVGLGTGAPERRQTWSNAESIFQRDDVLGHRPPPGYRTSSQLWFGHELVYDVVYTIDSRGLRSGPAAGTDPDRPCVLFFGGSYTFGEGVNDDETMPYLVGERSGGRFDALNFGFSGYGPHQMLAAIESGLVERAVDCTPRYAVYQAHPHHLLRAAGKWWWDKHGPRYRLQSDGTVVRDGNFDDDAGIAALLDDSTAVQRLRDQLAPSEEDVPLLEAIVRRSRRLLEAQFPGIEFHILYWDIGPPWLFEDAEATVGATVHRMSTILPNWELWEELYTFEHDVHPTPAAHSIIADYVVANVLPPAAEESSEGR